MKVNREMQTDFMFPLKSVTKNKAVKAGMRINKVYCMDVFDFLSGKVADNSIDLAVVDPPYNMKKASWDTFKSQDDFLNFTFSWIELLIPKLKRSSSLYIFNTPLNSAYILQFLTEKKMTFRNWIVWDKQDGMSAPKTKYVSGAETILFFTQGQHTFNFNDIREPYKSTERIKHAAQKGILKNGKRWYPNPDGRLCSEVWRFSSERHKQKVNGKLRKMDHLTPKPLDMIERIIKASSNEGDLILDCFMGSGTTARACKNLNRNFIGCEKNKKYYELCMKNINGCAT